MSVRLSVCLSVTSPYCVSTAKHRISKTTRTIARESFFFDAKNLYETTTGSPPTAAQKCRWGRQKLRFWPVKKSLALDALPPKISVHPPLIVVRVHDGTLTEKKYTVSSTTLVVVEVCWLTPTTLVVVVVCLWQRYDMKHRMLAVQYLSPLSGMLGHQSHT